jgi:predicted HicB family RNase H-like nuclease
LATKAHLEGNKRYLEKLDEMKIRVKKGRKAIIEEAAKKEGKSLNAYVIEAVDKQLTSTGNPSIVDVKEED